MLKRSLMSTFIKTRLVIIY